MPETIQADTDGYVYVFTVTNTGNIANSFDLTAGFGNLSAPVAALLVDSNGNGRLDDATDQRLDPVLSQISLQPGASAQILVLAQASGDMALTATSLNGDSDVTIAHRNAAAHIAPQATSTGAASGRISLLKTQSVNTTGTPASGDIITYTLVAHVPLDAGATNIQISDTVPAGTTYVASSITLDGAALSDASDGDSGQFDPASHALSVVLPDTSSTPASATAQPDHTVRFQVRIN